MKKPIDERTLLIHGTEEADPLYHSVTPPIYFSSTYQSNTPAGRGPFGYSRGSNPTRQILENQIAALEHGKYGYAFASGMAACAAALSLLKSGEHALVTGNVYGGTLSLFNKILSRWNISYTLVDTADPEAIRKAWTASTKMLYLETPSNPVLDVTDIAAAAAIAKEMGGITVVDNTFLSPYLQKPLDLGADIVVESATKYLAGHSDIIAGVVAVNDEELSKEISAFQKIMGGIIQPMDAYFLHRSIKTLAVRVDQAQKNAQEIAAFLDENPAVDHVYYPGLPAHPGYDVQKRQAAGPGAMISFLLNEKYDVEKFMKSLLLIQEGASLGGVESLISQPATGSHREFTPEQRKAAGILDNLIRFSVGIEAAGDLIADLRQAFEAARVN